MSVLLTGASGFVGRHVLAELASRFGAEGVIALSSSAGALPVRAVPAHGYSFGPGYLLGRGCGDVRAVVHLGAYTPKVASEADDVTSTAGNVASTAALLAACAELPHLERVVYTSTLDVYGSPEGVVDERTATSPETLYGWSKLHCEKMVQAFCGERGLRCAILRLGHVYGEGEEAYGKAIPAMLGRALRGEDVEVLGDGSAVRTFIYVGDVARAVAESLDLDSDETVNVVGDAPVTIAELASAIAGACGVGVRNVPSDRPPRTLEFDNSLLRELLVADFTPLREGIAREADYMRGLAGEA